MENAQIADTFDTIADLLELQEDNPFRVRSYRNAAQSIRNQSDRLETWVKDDKKLSSIPNIGDSIAEKIREIVKTGTCKRLEELRGSLPSGLTDLMNIPGVGPKKAMQIHKDLGVDSLAALKEACENHRIRELDGMGAKTEEKILKGIATVQRTAGRMLFQEAADQLDTLSTHLDDIKALDRWEVAGSFRRRKETIGDLDILVHANDRAAATDAILKYKAIADVISRGKERVSIRLDAGLQIDFRFFDSSSFGAAWMYFTGSKAHNIRLRRIAQDKDWKLNEYGLMKNDRHLAGKSESGVYHRLDMDWIPPELREDTGEIDAALDTSLPKLIEASDIRGDLQSHTTASDGKHSIKAMAEAARNYGLDYLAITDHSQRVTMANGLNDDRVRKHADAIRKVNADMKKFWLLAGIEVDILKNGKLDLKAKTLESLDWVVASIHYDRAMSRKAMTDRILNAVTSGLIHCLAHPLGRIIGKRDPIVVDLDRVFAACAENHVAIEINCQPKRLDLPDKHCRAARDAGVMFTFGTDAHSTDGFHFLPLGANVARRGWLRKKDVLNTRSIAQLKKIIGHTAP